MNEKTILNLKIAYIKYRISRLPKGWIGTYRNRQVVYIIRDPDDPKVSNIRRRRLFTNTRRGLYYKNRIEEYQYEVRKYKELIAEWKKNYIGEPEIIRFPLNRFDYTGITSEQFFNSRPNQNSYEIKHPIHYKGQTLRSKNELLTVQLIEEMGFEWKTEIMIKRGKYYFYPDVAFYVPYIDKVIALELDGMMEDDEYYSKAEERRGNYIRSGFIENKDVIFFRLVDNNSFNLEDLKAMIESAIERNIAGLRIGRPAIGVFV